MSILKKTRADLSVSLYFHTPCLNLSDVVMALWLYATWGGTEHFFTVLDSHKRDFDNFKTVHEIIREFYASQKRDEEIQAQKASGKKSLPPEKSPAEKVKGYIENEKVYTRLRSIGETGETIVKIREVQKKFQGRFVS